MESIDAVSAYDQRALATIRRILLRVGDPDIDAILEDPSPERCVRAATLIARNQGIGITDEDIEQALIVLGADARRRAGNPHDLPALIVEGRPRLAAPAEGGGRA